MSPNAFKVWNCKRLRIGLKTPPSFVDTYRCADVKVFVLFVCHKVICELDKAQLEHESGRKPLPAESLQFLRVRARCCERFVTFVQTLSKAGLILTTAQRETARKAGREFLRNYVWMASACKASGVLLFSTRPKLHAIDHQVRRLWQSAENPFFHSCWMEEHLMGQVRKSVSGAHAASMLRTGMSRWILRVWQASRPKL